MAAAGQESPAIPKLPDGPLLKPAPDFSQWVITFSYPADKTKKIDSSAPSSFAYLNAYPRSVVTTRTGAMTREVSTDLIGRVSEKWYLGSLEYRKIPVDPIWYQNENDSEARGGNINFTPLPSSGFRGFDGVSAQAYTGTVHYQDRDCLVFIPDGKGAAPVTSADQLAGMDNILLVDATSRLPVEARAKGVVRVFAFMAPPSQKLVLEDDLVAQIKAGNEGRARLNQRPPRPY